jgi:tetratricopeptide (TPR) repeat protein
LYPERLDSLSAASLFALRVLCALGKDDRQEARASWDLMRDIAANAGAPSGEASAERATFPHAAVAAYATGVFDSLLAHWPIRQRSALAGGLTKLMATEPARPQRLADLWIREAGTAQRLGRPQAALTALERADRMGLGPQESRRAARLYGELGEYRRALAAVMRSAQRGPQDLGLLCGLAAGARAKPRQDDPRIDLDILGFAATFRLEAGQRRRVADLLLDAVASTLKSGSRRESLGALSALERLGPDETHLCRMMGLYTELGEPAPALSAFRRAQGSTQCPADPLLSLAGAAKTAGRRAEALGIVDAVSGRSLDETQTRAAARLYGELDEPGKAATVLRRLRRTADLEGIEDAGRLLDIAEAAMRAGRPDPDLALRCLGQARGLRLQGEGLDRAAVLYQSLRRYRAARELLEQLVGEQPRQARWRSDLGMVEMLLGLREAAVRDWQQAISLDPGFLPAYLSLGSLYASSGQKQKALRLYARALERRPPEDAGNRHMRELIEAESAGLR